MSIYSSYLHEYSTYVALLYVGKKPFSDPQIIWGHFPLKGVKKCTGKSFALFGGQAFLKEFEGLNRADTAKRIQKLVGVLPTERAPQTTDSSDFEIHSNPTTSDAKKQKCQHLDKDKQSSEKLFKKLVDAEIADVVYTGVHDSINDAIGNSSPTPSINGANVDENLNDKDPQNIQEKAGDVAPPSQDLVNAQSPDFQLEELAFFEETYIPSPVQPKQLFPSQQTAQMSASFYTHPESGNPSASLYNPGIPSSFFPSSQVGTLADRSGSVSFSSNSSWQSSMQPSFVSPSPETLMYRGNFGLPSFVAPNASLWPVHPPNFAQQQLQNARTPSTCIPLICSPTQNVPPQFDVGGYFKRHRFSKVWGERNSEKAKKLPVGDKGKAPKKVNIPITGMKTNKFKNRASCALYSTVFKPSGKACPAMEAENVTKDTQYLCEQCQVHLHISCHTLYHQFLATEKIPISACSAAFQCS